MSWVKVDDRLPHHKKVRSLPPALALAAWGLYVAGLCYAQDQKTDGRIEVDDLQEVMSVAPPRQRFQCAAALVKVGLWDPHPDGDGWLIHDYLDHNASAAVRRSKAKAAADARWHAPRIASRMPTALREHASVAMPNDASSTPLLSSPLHSPPSASHDASSIGSDEEQANRDAYQRLVTGLSERLGFRP